MKYGELKEMYGSEDGRKIIDEALKNLFERDLAARIVSIDLRGRSLNGPGSLEVQLAVRGWEFERRQITLNGQAVDVIIKHNGRRMPILGQEVKA